MSWRLEFYRRVGQPPLSLEESDTAFAHFEHLTRSTSPTDGPEREEVLYQRIDRETGTEADVMGGAEAGSEGSAEGTVRYFFSYLPDSEGEEDPGRPDFPYERTPLELGVPFFQSEAVARQAVETAVDACAALDLLALDPQMEQEIPGRPDAEVLVRSYTTYNRDVEDTLAFVRSRSRTVAIGVLVVLAVIILWMTLALIGRR